MNLGLNFRGELGKISQYLVDELDQIIATINVAWDEQHNDLDILRDGSVTLNQLAFRPVSGETIIATINASTEGLRIDASKIQINGDVQFATGYDPSQKIPVGGAAADVNNGTTTISGGKITTGSITAAQLAADLVVSNKIRSSGATAYGTGTGFWLDATVGSPTFRVGNPTGNRIAWDGANLTIRAGNVTLTSAGLTLSGGSTTKLEFDDADAQIWGTSGGLYYLVPSGKVHQFGGAVSMLSSLSVSGSASFLDPVRCDDTLAVNGNGTFNAALYNPGMPGFNGILPPVIKGTNGLLYYKTDAYSGAIQWEDQYGTLHGVVFDGGICVDAY